MLKPADNQATWEFSLQLFAEGEGSTPSDAGESGSAPEVTPTPPDSGQGEGKQSLAEFLQSRMAGPAPDNKPEPPPVEVVPNQDVKPREDEPRVDIPDKFKNPDGSINADALLKSYTNMETMYSRYAPQFERVGQLEHTIAILQQQIAQQAHKANEKAPEEEEITPENLEAKIAEATEDPEFWDNPGKSLTKLIREAIKAEIEPINQKIEPIHHDRVMQAKIDSWAEKIQAFRKDAPDFDELTPTMREIADQYGDMLTSRADAVEVMYNLAKAKHVQSTPPPAKPATIDDLFNDQGVLDKLVQDPRVRNQVLAAHIQDLQKNPPPQVIGSGGIPSATPPADLKDMKTAKEALKAKYAGFNLQ